MATIKTIMPAGGGDFTTLAAWEDWADAQLDPNQWAECYSGGSLGSVALSTWSATIDATNYPRIYAAPGHRHGGNFSAGAYINAGDTYGVLIATNYAVVDGLRAYMTASGVLGFGRFTSNASGEFWNCLSTAIGTSPSAFKWGITNSGALLGFKLVNCIGVGTSVSQAVHIEGSNDNGTFPMSLLNNTFRAASSTRAVYFELAAAVTLSLTARNNWAGGATTAWVKSAAGTINKTTSHNAAGDGTATSLLAGTNNIDNTSATANFVDPTNSNFQLLEAAPLRNAGLNVASLGVQRDVAGVRRPQGDTFDIGAFEYPIDELSIATALARRSRFASMGRIAP